MRADKEAGVAESNVLGDILRLAREEGVLADAGLAAFASALRERADLIIEERLARLEERVRTLDQENAWRRESMASLGAASERQHAVLAAAVEAHERLLAHHRGVLERVAAELLAAADLPLWRRRAARRRLVALAALLRQEVP
jgi:hypothetical protein